MPAAPTNEEATESRGISSREWSSRLFQPFVTTKTTGMGVGLSICRTIIEAHGGRLDVERNGTGWATFRLTLQAAHEGDPVKAAELVHVVDDDPAMRDSIAFLLGTEGFEVRLYGAAAELLDRLEKPASGCVLTDIRMPGIDGLDLLRRLRAADHALPVIMMTGHGDVPLAVEAENRPRAYVDALTRIRLRDRPECRSCPGSANLPVIRCGRGTKRWLPRSPYRPPHA